MAATNGATRPVRAVDDLYRAHAGEVYRYAYAMLGNRADAEDVTQTTFINALRALERGDRPRKPSNWLVTIAHNIVRQRFRQQQSRPAEVELDHDVAQEEAEHNGPSIEDLVQALQRIPPTQREAIVMRELEGRSYKEIEALLELTPSALETLLFRARRSLADELENLVTCERAELAISKQLDGRLSRKERRRLDEHLRECAACARLNAGRSKHRRAFGALSLLPLPFSIPFFRDASTASAAGTAGGLSTIGAGSVTTAGGVTAAAGITAATCGSSCVTGFLAGGVAVKAVAVVAAATVAGSVGYEGVKHAREATQSNPPAVVASAQHRAQGPAAAAAAAAAGAAAGASKPVQTTGAVVDTVRLPDDPTYAISVPASQAPQPSLAVDGSQAAGDPVEPSFVIVLPPDVQPQTPPAAEPSSAGTTPQTGSPSLSVTIVIPPDPAPVKAPTPVDNTTVVPVTPTPTEPTDTKPPTDTTPPTNTTPPTDTTPATPTEPAPTTPAGPAPTPVPETTPVPDVQPDPAPTAEAPTVPASPATEPAALAEADPPVSPAIG